ncbi:catalase family protein [uncultured Pseudacidovorax sp.]|uniref:catalase family protein n=1 Tax=uncultured Pseudacidovorax sp. TaxID=679313 RepID=UPI0025D4D112|nr:catalase family protein [uncultured Pseudacidovorax sp.]
MTPPAQAPVTPLHYRPEFEQTEEDELQIARELGETMIKISQQVHRDEGHAYRSVHAKAHGLLRAEVEVLDGLPADYAQGLFGTPGRYGAVMRLSTPPGDLLSDKVSTPRGVALKLVGVPGERMEGSEGEVTQDFVMVNGPVFRTPNAKKFLGNLKLLAATTDRAPKAKEWLSAALRGVEKTLEAVGAESGALKSMGAHPLTHLLGETFFTQVPVLYGTCMAKLRLTPVSPELLALKDQVLDMDDSPNAIRDAVVSHFRAQGGTWELQVQLCTDLDAMPIEDATVEWPEDRSPYVTVARVTAGPQNAWSDARVKAVDDGMAFSPWHGLAAHRPLGSIMRVRRIAYVTAAAYRETGNRVSVAQPATLDNFPD